MSCCEPGGRSQYGKGAETLSPLLFFVWSWEQAGRKSYRLRKHCDLTKAGCVVKISQLLYEIVHLSDF